MFLDDEKYDRIGFNSGNSRNGVYERTLHTEYGDLKLEIPRDRNGDFHQQTIAPTESVHVWRELLEDFRERGMEEVLLFISDGLKGMETMLSEVYPHARYQTCLVHVQRNLSHKVRTKDRAEVCDDFKQVYRAETLEEAIEARERFIKKWQAAYPKL